jgi:hypothetical protein
MRKKGFVREESPEKMPSQTAGIQMDRKSGARLREQLTGGNQPADETDVARQVTEYIRKGL